MTLPPEFDSPIERDRPISPSAVAQGFEIGTDGVSAVVVGFDGTDPSRDALAFAAGVARRNGGRLIVVYVIHPGVMTGMSPQAAGVVHSSAIEESENLRAEIVPMLAGLGVHPGFVVREGDVAREIETVAAAEHADAIVVGRSASRAHAVMGSVALALVKHAQRPVCVVP